MLSCYLHPSSSAEDRCARCRRTICPVCVVVVSRGTATLCRSCADEHAHERRRLRIGLLAAALLLCAGLLTFLFLPGGG